MDSPSDAEVIGRSWMSPKPLGWSTIAMPPPCSASWAAGWAPKPRRDCSVSCSGSPSSGARRLTRRANALPWLYGIGSNLLLKHRRAEARRLRASARMAAADHPADRRTSAAAFDARVLFPRVADAIDSLPDPEREALLLFVWEELPYQSVAEALELPIGTVRSRLNRARARLRELLEPKGKGRERSR